MRQPRLYCPDLCPGTVELSPEESSHLVASLRATEGSEVVLFDGAGGEATGVLQRAHRRRAQVVVGPVTRRPFELAYRLTLAVAMGRTHRQGYLVEKCTELGVAAIWPIVGARSVARPDKDAVAKWSRRAIEAAKQSGRAWVPEIAAPMHFAELLGRVEEFDAAAVADPSSSGPGRCAVIPFDTVLAALPAEGTVLALVGPEGGWSDDERAQLQAGRMATATRLTVVSLGPTILRTETAAVALCAAVAMASLRNS